MRVNHRSIVRHATGWFGLLVCMSSCVEPPVAESGETRADPTSDEGPTGADETTAAPGGETTSSGDSGAAAPMWSDPRVVFESDRDVIALRAKADVLAAALEDRNGTLVVRLDLQGDPPSDVACDVSDADGWDIERVVYALDPVVG